MQHAPGCVLVRDRSLLRITTEEHILRRRPRTPRVIGRTHADRAVADHDARAVRAREYLEHAAFRQQLGDRELADAAAVEHHPLPERLHPRDAHVIDDVLDFPGLNAVLGGIEIDGSGVAFVAAEARGAVGAGTGVVVDVPGESRTRGHIDIGEVQPQGRALGVHTNEPRPTPEKHAAFSVGAADAAGAAIVLFRATRTSLGHEVRDGAHRGVCELVGEPLVNVGVLARIGEAAHGDELANRIRADAAEIGVSPDRAGPIGAEAAAGNGSAGSVEQRVARAAGRVVAAREGEARLLVGRHTEKADRRIAGIAFAAIGILAATLRFAGDEQTELTRAVAEAAQRCLELFHRPARIDA